MQVTHLTNFVSQELANALETYIGHHQFPWYWRPSSQYGIDEQGLQSQDFQFVHMIYYDNAPQSEIFDLVCNLLAEFEKYTGISIKTIYKIKANLLTNQHLDETGLAETVHTDLDKSEKTFISMVYYVSDSDGDTIIYNDQGEIVKQTSPVKGTAVYFSSHTPHRATPPTKNKRRLVLNIVLEI
jgi:predicted 2-oxoglutarate/Fe(II)-dependent dioxygenase YbiX